MFRDSSDVRNYSYEIMVSIPSWYNVEMEMIGNASACSFPKITTNIKTIRRQMVLEYLSRLLDQKHQTTIFLLTKISNAANVSFGCDKEVPIGIWKSVKKDNSIMIPIEQEVFLTYWSLARGLKNAMLYFRGLT